MGEREPAPREGGGRIKAVLRLVLLLGTPVLILFTIFAGGVYFGASRSQGVVGFEQRWLSIDPPEGFVFETDPGEPAKTEPAKTEPAKTEPAKTEPTKTEPAKTEPTKTEPTKTEPTKTEPAKTEPTKTELDLPIAVRENLTGPLGEAFAREREVEVKILVDPALLVVHQDWLAYVQQLFGATHDSFQQLFGISLRLHGVVLWEQASADPTALLADLAARDREGADVILGLVARPRPAGFEAPLWDRENGGYAVVFADLDLRERYYRGLLRAMAGLFGATPVHDPNAAAWLRGSFMSGAPVSNESSPPWIDAENRDAVIANKQRSFAATTTAATADKPKPKPKAEADDPKTDAEEL